MAGRRGRGAAGTQGVAVAICLLAGSAQAQQLTWIQEQTLIETSKTTAANSLRDPSSARFEGVRVSYKLNGKPVVCGYVNAKNGFGGYAGRMRWMGAGSTVTFDSDDPNFAGYWNKLC